MSSDQGDERQGECQIRPLGSEAGILAAGLGSSPYLDASFLSSLVDRDLIHCLNGREAWTAWIGEEPCGFLILDPGPDRVAELTLAVLPAARRRGIGRRLVEFARERGRSEGWARLTILVELQNKGGLAFFGNLGFADGHTQLKDYRCMRQDLPT